MIPCSQVSDLVQRHSKKASLTTWIGHTTSVSRAIVWTASGQHRAVDRAYHSRTYYMSLIVPVTLIHEKFSICVDVEFGAGPVGVLPRLVF